MKHKKTFIISGIVIIILFFVILNLTRGEKRIRVQIAEVKKGEIISTVSGPGTVKAVTEVKIGAYVMGRITHLPVKEGEKVKKGDILVQIDPAAYSALVKQDRAALELAKANLAQSELLFKRKKTLFEAGLISQEEFETLQTQYNVDKARLLQSEASLEQAQDQLSKTMIRSPIDGTVTQLNVELGEVVVTGTMNNPGSVIMTVADFSKMEVEAQIDESEVKDVYPEQKAEITVDALPDTILHGEVTEVGNAAITQSQSASQEQATSFNVKVLFKEKPSSLRSGMSATVKIITAEKKDILYAPIQSVVMRAVEKELKEAEKKPKRQKSFRGNPESFRDEEKKKEKEQTVVYILDKGTARLRPVKTGVSDEEKMEILNGLKEGEQVIKGPFRILKTLKEGTKVKSEKGEKVGKRE
ncbi:MAG: efflux RND transporter periplasmic adaptor subunit [Candidatus Edwardsbacteria bacterium]